jgi:SRSO17 transposase
MLQRSFTAGVRLAWLTGDSVYGDDRKLREWLEGRPQAYVLAGSGKESVWINQEQRQIKTLLATLPSAGWARLSAGVGSKGPRWYDWLRVELSEPAQQGWKRWLLVRRSISDPSDLTAYLVFARAATPLTELVRVAGMRWTVEERIQTAKGEVGLDHYEVRSWSGWYRHMTLAMWAQAFLTIVRAETGATVAAKKGLHKPRTTSSLAAFKAHRRLQCG